MIIFYEICPDFEKMDIYNPLKCIFLPQNSLLCKGKIKEFISKIFNWE